MPIRKYINDRAFTPDQIERLSVAYEGALATLQIHRSDPLAEEIARKIIEVSDADGDCTSAILYTRALAELGLPERRYFSAAQE
jgi:hypothetical protein